MEDGHSPADVGGQKTFEVPESHLAIFDGFKIGLVFPLFGVLFLGYVAYTGLRRLFWHNGINRKTARRLRNCFLRNQTWRWYHLGFVPWISLNSILYEFDCKHKQFAGKNTTGKRGIEAFCAVREACERDSDFEDLRRIWHEMDILEYPDFIKRDLKFFNEREGMVLTDPAKVLIRYVLVMQRNDFLKLYHVMNTLCRRHLAKLKKLRIMDSALIRHFVQNDRDKFICFRKQLLTRMKTYAHNMIMYTLETDRDAAHAWHDVCKRIVHLLEMEPNDKNEDMIRKDVEELIARMDKACGYTSVCMVELRQRSEAEAEADAAAHREKEGQAEEVEPDDPAAAFKDVNYGDPHACLAWFQSHIGWKCQRLVIRREESGDGFYIADTLRMRGKTISVRKRWEYHGMTAAMKMRVVLRLLEQFATNPGKPMTSIKGESWKSRFPSAEIYGQFKADQIINQKNSNGTYTNKWRFLTDEEVRKAMNPNAGGHKGGHKRS